MVICRFWIVWQERCHLWTILMQLVNKTFLRIARNKIPCIYWVRTLNDIMHQMQNAWAIFTNNIIIQITSLVYVSDLLQQWDLTILMQASLRYDTMFCVSIIICLLLWLHFTNFRATDRGGAYIATQTPLPNTVNDFWRMVFEHEVKCVVMLCKKQERGQVMTTIITRVQECTRSLLHVQMTIWIQIIAAHAKVS